MGAKDLMWFPSASFPCHEPVIELMKSGVVHHIEGSMNGPLGDYCSHGKMRGLGVLRSHGGRWQAVQDGEVHIDIAVIAAPTADFFGNADGVARQVGLRLARLRAGRLRSMPTASSWSPTTSCRSPASRGRSRATTWTTWSRSTSIGDPSKIVSGTTQITRSPDRLRIAELVAQLPARQRHHARRLLLPGRRRRHRAGLRRLPARA